MTKPKIGRKPGSTPGSTTNSTGMAALKAVSRDELEALYRGGRTAREIGSIFGVSRAAVDNQFIRLRIDRRKPEELGTLNNSKLSIGLLPEQEHLLLGSLLGDACLHRQKYQPKHGAIRL